LFFSVLFYTSLGVVLNTLFLTFSSMVVVINVGLIGLGNIGSGVVEIISKNSELILKRTGVKIILKKICDARPQRAKELGISDKVFTTNYKDVLADKEISVVVELIGGYEPARTVVVDAINAGKNIVTANKALLARHGFEIFDLAQKRGVSVLFEAAVGGCIPIIRTIEESHSSDKLRSVVGILNGTTNYILTRMSEGMSYSDALKKAQELGFAEANPEFDVSGKDAAQKISILSSIAFDAKFSEDFFVCGITDLTKEDLRYSSELGYAIKLLAVGKKVNGSVEVRVHPALIPKENLFADVSNELNAVLLDGENTGKIFFSGKGAGRLPTATVVVTDLIEMGSRGRVTQRYFEKTKLVDFNELEFKYYLRLGVVDEVGVLAKLTKIFGEEGVSIALITQKDNVGGVVNVIFLTHPAKEKQMSAVIEKVKKYSGIRGIHLIRFEDFS
jgi:homoserine dehydrogenase